MTHRQEQFALDMAREIIDAEDHRRMGHTYTAITLARALVYAKEPKPFRWPHEVQDFGA